MSSPSPGPQSSIDNSYQPSDTSDHTLISYNHSCQCLNSGCPLETPKTCTLQCGHIGRTSHLHGGIHPHHHPSLTGSHSQNAINNHQSVHVHVHNSLNQQNLPPKTSTTPCNCHHVKTDEESSNADKGEVEGQGKNNKTEAEDDIRIEVSPLPPALPPRPPPRPRGIGQGTVNSRTFSNDYNEKSNSSGGGIKKYVFCCCVCGGIATILGALFLAVYFLLRSYTSTLGYFETIPTFVPATMLILTGLCVMSLARRKNRYSYLIKFCGLCCLVCALTCVLVTITTTVIHMNRLQTLRECVYTQKTRTCTCYSVLLEAHAPTEDGTGMRFVFDSTPDCEVIHGALYSCLRAMFGLSVSGILVCIFSCMLVYQLLSHEKKKMYWEQLELRCRSLYQQHPAPSIHNSMRGPAVPPTTYCSCCEECRYPSVPTGPQVYPWDSHHPFDSRFWAPGRVGNFYSPNPGEEGHELGENGRERTGGGWNWRRLPWNRSNANQQSTNEVQRDNASSTYHGAVSSSDSQYGFTNRNARDGHQNNEPASGSSGGSYSVLNSRPVGGVYVWGPPPPYSNPNSPARRPFQSPSRHYHVHHHPHPHTSLCQINQENQPQNLSTRSRIQIQNKDNYENTGDAENHPANENSESTDTSSCIDRISHTLPVRKVKKRAEISSVKSVSQPPVNTRASVQNVFNQNCKNFVKDEIKNQSENLRQKNSENSQCRFLPRLQGVENAAFQNQEGNTPQKLEPTESEVYFADVSSCCNISVKNDGQDSLIYDEAIAAQTSRLCSLGNHQGGAQKQHQGNKESDFERTSKFHDNISSSTVTEDEEYLAQKLGKRQMSTRSRLPFPLPDSEEIVLSEVPPDGNILLLPKDLSQNSLCSSVQTPLTETTDDAVSPTTPTFPKNDCCLGYYPEERHRVNSNPNNDHFLAPDAQYEIIPEKESQKYCHNNYSDDCGTSMSFSNLTNTISGLSGLHSYGQNYHGNVNYNSPTTCGSPSQKKVPPKTLNLNQSPNRRIGSNISTLIQNLGANPVGLLYGEANSTEEEEIQGQGSHSDGTMDSGWQSGSEKQDKERSTTSNENNTNQNPINV